MNNSSVDKNENDSSWESLVSLITKTNLVVLDNSLKIINDKKVSFLTRSRNMYKIGARISNSLQEIQITIPPQLRRKCLLSNKPIG